MSDRIVIVGAGQAAAQAVQTLRAENVAAPITMIGDEAYLPYQRPPLSKKFLAGELEAERLLIRPVEFYKEAAVEIRLGQKVVALDRKAKAVRLGSGEVIPYGKLLLATGSRVRRLGGPNAELPGVFYLRDIADVDAIRPHFKPGARLTVIGGGYVGLEVAAVAAKSGLEVTVLEIADRVLARVASPEISSFFEAEHKKAGVAIRTRCGAVSIEGKGKLEAVRAGDDRINADLLIVGIGILPNMELAADAGLACDNGILVDENARTSDPDILAAGDCTTHPNPLMNRRLRLESVQNAIDQAKAAAHAMAGRPRPYAEVPWFWSDQYDLKLQSAGLSEPGDARVLRGEMSARKFAVFHLRDGVVVAVECVNAAPEYMIGRQLIAKKARIAPERLADVNTPMKALI